MHCVVDWFFWSWKQSQNIKLEKQVHSLCNFLDLWMLSLSLGPFHTTLCLKCLGVFAVLVCGISCFLYQRPSGSCFYNKCINVFPGLLSMRPPCCHYFFHREYILLVSFQYLLVSITVQHWSSFILLSQLFVSLLVLINILSAFLGVLCCHLAFTRNS